MVIGAFPIAKLSVLLIKQISKPIANACKERAKHHPFFRTYFCMPPAQFYNWCEVKAKMWILNLGKPVNIPVLSQEMAIELGANLLGESVIFIIGSVLLIFEYNRQSNKEAAKESKRLAEMNYITSTLQELYFTVQQQQTQLKEMERMVLNLKPGTKPSSDEPPKSPKDAGTGGSPPMPVLKPQNVQQTISTPYPNSGFILRSLNYIQMDVLSSSIFSYDTNSQNIKQSKEKENQTYLHQREGSVLSEALHNIENNFRSLF